MGEYVSPLNKSRRETPQNNEDDFISFVSTPPGPNSSGNWGHNYNPRRSSNFQNQNQRHSTPNHRGGYRGSNRGYSTPYYRGNRPNHHDNRNERNKTPRFRTESYFHPSMLGNPWAELELKLEKTQSTQNKDNSDASESHSDSE